MQRPDEQKRQQILQAAAHLFTSLPFHAVRLEDVAAAAHVGKGTIYIYFKNKDDLFYCLIREGLMALVDQVRQKLGDQAGCPLERLRDILLELVRFGRQYPHVFQSFQTIARLEQDQDLAHKRLEMVKLVEGVIRQGVETGELCDEHPQLTALMMLGGLRTITMQAGMPHNDELLIDHMLKVVAGGIRTGRAGARIAAGSNPDRQA